MPSGLRAPEYDLAPPPPGDPPPEARRGVLLRILAALAAVAGRLGWRLNLILLVATLLTTTFGGGWFFADPVEIARRGVLGGLRLFVVGGLGYALAVMLILGSHEMGHYLFCRYYGVRATLPYFLPAPPPILFGTFGAVIRMRPPIPGRKALFDIGIAGPIAGFLVAIPVLVYGVATAAVERVPANAAVYWVFHDPLLIKFLTAVLRGHLLEGSSLMLNPALFAGWFGLLVTAMNLFPVGQLDGGHVAFAVSRRLHRALSRLTIVGMIGLVTATSFAGIFPTWFAWTLILFLLGRSPHPPVERASEPLGALRLVLAAGALIILVLCFLPVPIELRSEPG